MKDLFMQSKYIEVITSIMEKELNSKVTISQIHTIKIGDGNSVFYLVTKENDRFLIDLAGLKIQTNDLLYWIENINHAGKICDFFYDRDIVIITFQRGENYKNEYLSYIYIYGHQYPSIKFIPNEIYPNYSKNLTKKFKKHYFELPKEFVFEKE